MVNRTEDECTYEDTGEFCHEDSDCELCTEERASFAGMKAYDNAKARRYND